MQFTLARSKDKSRLHHDIIELHSQKVYLWQVSTFYTFQLPQYSPEKNFKFKVITARSKSNYGDTMMFHTYTPSQYPCQASTSCTLQLLRYRLDRILNVTTTTVRQKIKSRSYYNVAHLYHQPMWLPCINILHLMVSGI